jgi:hypothetical protein
MIAVCITLSRGLYEHQTQGRDIEKDQKWRYLEKRGGVETEWA